MSDSKSCTREGSSPARAASCARAAARTPSDWSGSAASAASRTLALRGMANSFSDWTTVEIRVRASSPAGFERSRSLYAAAGSAAAIKSATTTVMPAPVSARRQRARRPLSRC